MDFKKEELVKSPLNYVGGKFKLLPQILPLFPDEINVFYDLFCGGCNVGVNIKANKIICSDIETHLIDLMENLSKMSSKEAITILEKTISKYNLSKTNEEGFKKIRSDFNKGNSTWDMFYALVTNAFNYHIRFNSNGEYNMPFGRDRSSFNPALKKRFIKFVDRLRMLDIEFVSNNFQNIDINKLNNNDFIYCDPPYLITLASYNENNKWGDNEEHMLLDFLDNINSKGVKFALSNVLENKGKQNYILKEWSKKYKINYLNNTYGNCNYHAKDKGKNNTVEVLITNY